MTGRIILVATPIGNRADASTRLIDTLAAADVIAAEDTRRVRRLLTDLGVRTRARVVAHHEHNEAAGAQGLVAAAQAGQLVAVVSDAGMPTVSDPGFRLVRAAVAAGVSVAAVPGPSAVLAALAVSGLPTDRFCFEGFVPRRTGERARALADLAGERRTMVFFEAPRRLAGTLAAMAEAFGPGRAAVVCRELTKLYEEVLRDDLAGLTRWATDTPVLGEITVVVAGASAGSVAVADLVPQVLRAVADGSPLRAAVKEVAQGTGVPTRELYDAVVTARSAPGADPLGPD